MSRTLLRGARVITMVPDRPDWERLDVVVEDSRIAEFGMDLDAAQARADVVLDFADRVIIPGLVNAHLHTWQSALRTVGADWTLSQYLGNSHGTLAHHYRADDMRIASRAGALGQIMGGTTTIGDWCHNTPTPEHTDAALEGLMTTGVRAVFLHGTSYTGPTRHPVQEVDRIMDGPARDHELLTVGMAIRGPQLSSADVAVADLRAARERGVVASMHQSGGAPKPAWRAVRKAELFSPSMNIAHGAGLTEEWVRILVDAGVTFTSTPENELGQGHGAPITAQLLPLGAAPSLGTDTDCVVGGDLLSAARIALAHQRGLDHDRHRRLDGMFSMTPTVTGKQALSWATVEGARALGLADRVGRLEPGMQADLVVIDTRELNLWPAHDPIAAALQASFGNIEAVMIAGTWRKRDHALVGGGIDQVQDQLAESGARLLHPLLTPGMFGKARQRIVERVVSRRLRKEVQTPPADMP